MDRPELSPEPSDVERSEWPDATHFYVQDLEEQYAAMEAENERMKALCREVVEADGRHKKYHLKMNSAHAQHVIDSEGTGWLNESLKAAQDRAIAIDKLRKEVEQE